MSSTTHLVYCCLCILFISLARFIYFSRSANGVYILILDCRLDIVGFIVVISSGEKGIKLLILRIDDI
jgi:hypothetical protein